MDVSSRSLRRGFKRLALVLILPAVLLVLLFLLPAQPAASHGFPIIDGAFTGDWCAPAFKGLFGPDSYTVLTPPACALGTEFFWDDWDSVVYGGGLADTMGWLVGGVPMFPLSDPEVDIDFFATTADPSAAFFVVTLGPFPSTGGPPPHVQIAIDLDGPVAGNMMWYDPPPPGGTGLVGAAAMPAPLPADYLITTDVVANIGFLWEATTLPGIWTLVAPVPLAWSGNIGPGPQIIEIAVPWPLFAPGPPFGLGIPAAMTVMAAHSKPFIGPSDTPLTPEDDVLTELGAGFTTSPDVCPPGPPSSDCELFWGPGGGAGSADAFIMVNYPTPPTINFNPAVLTSTQLISTTVVKTATVNNSGMNPLVWTIAEDAAGTCAGTSDINWIGLSTAGATTAPGATDVISVTFDATVVSAGTYNAALCVNSNDPLVPAITVPVTLTAMPLLPAINVNPSSLGSTQQVSVTVTKTLTISNTGIGNLVWTIAEDTAGTCAGTGDISWIGLSTSGGTTSPGASDIISVTFDATVVPTGTYSGALCINSNDPIVPAITVPVSMTVTPVFMRYLPAVFLPPSPVIPPATKPIAWPRALLPAMPLAITVLAIGRRRSSKP